jgi:hypothetical protein
LADGRPKSEHAEDKQEHEKKKGQHAGWMPKCAKLSQAYKNQQWAKCDELIGNYKWGSFTFAQMVDGWK